MMTTASVRGCAKLCRPVAVAHGFLPVLSAHGRSEEHVSFQPAHEEQTGEPHAAQNWLCRGGRAAVSDVVRGARCGTRNVEVGRTHLVARVPVNDAPRFGKDRGLEWLERGHRRAGLREHELRAGMRCVYCHALEDDVHRFLGDIAHVEREVGISLHVGDDRLQIGVGAEVGRG